LSVEIARACHTLIAHERPLLADCEDAAERVMLLATFSSTESRPTANLNEASGTPAFAASTTALTIGTMLVFQSTRTAFKTFCPPHPLRSASAR
jgi:hypothetical protein